MKKRILSIYVLFFIGLISTVSCENQDPEDLDPMIEISSEELEEIIAGSIDLTSEFDNLASENLTLELTELNALFLDYLNKETGGNTTKNSCGTFRQIFSFCTTRCNYGNDGIMIVLRRWCGPPSGGNYEYATYCIRGYCGIT